MFLLNYGNYKYVPAFIYRTPSVIFMEEKVLDLVSGI
jgi:hypothetical protein